MSISSKKNFIYSLFSSFGGKILTAVIGLITVPIFIQNWGDVRYGIWSLVFSMLAYLSVSGLGIDQAAGVLMAKAVKEEDKEKILFRSIILVTFFSLLSTFVFIAVSLLNPSWVNILGKVPNEYSKELYLITFILGISYLVNLPFSVVRSGFHGFQKLYIEYLFNILLPVVNLGLLLICTYMLKVNLSTYALFYSILMLIINLVKAYYLFSYILQNNISKCLQNVWNSKKSDYFNLLISGIKYFGMGILAFVLFSTDNLVISKILGVGKIASYAITFKLFSMVSMFIAGAIVSSFLPLAGLEFGKDNWYYLNEKYQFLSSVLVIIGGGVWIGGVFILKYVIQFWVGLEFYPGYWTVFLLGCYSFLYSSMALSGGLLQSFHYLKWALIVSIIDATINIGVSIFLAYKIGLTGIALGTVLGASCSFILFPFFLKKTSNNKIKINVLFTIKHVIFALIPPLTLSILIRSFKLGFHFVLPVLVLSLLYYIYISFLLLPNAVKRTIISRIKFKRTLNDI